MSVNRLSRQSFGVRLTCERLEDRLTPAGYWWQPVDGTLSTTAENWLKGPSVPDERWGVAPGVPDTLIFQGGAVSGDAGCVIPQPAGPAGQNAFAGIHLVFGPPASYTKLPPPEPPPEVGYWGAVTTEGSFAVGALTVECGYLRQADQATIGSQGHAGTLTVTATLVWTGGTLNSNTVAGHIDLAAGAAGTAAPSFTDPGIDGTVTLGSTLTLKGNAATQTGSTLSMIGGTFNVLRGGVVAEALSTLLLQPADKPGDPPPAPPIKSITVNKQDWTPGADGVINIKAGSTAAVVRPVGSFTGLATLELTGEGAKFTNSGTTTIGQGTEVKFTDLKDDNASYHQTGANAVTVWHGNSAITSNKKTPVKIDEGVLEIKTVILNAQVVPPKVTVPNSGNLALRIGKDATLKLNDRNDARLVVEGGGVSIHGTLAVAINPRGPQASQLIVKDESLMFHEVPTQYKAKIDVTHKITGDGSQLPVGEKWPIATTPMGLVSGVPEMTATSTDYEPTTPIDGKTQQVRRKS